MARVPIPEGLFSDPPAEVRVGDPVLVNGALRMRVAGPPRRGKVPLVSERSWRRLEDGLPISLGELYVVPLTDVQVTGATSFVRRLRQSVGWETGCD